MDEMNNANEVYIFILVHMIPQKWNFTRNVLYSLATCNELFSGH